MDKSPTITELAKALCNFQSKMGTVVFDANNPFFKSKYATLSAIVSKAKPILTDCGLAISQLTEGEGGVTTILMHESGEFIYSTLTLKSVKDDPQGHGSAITYARRYSYASILGIVSDEDDDGNESSHVSAQPKKHNATTGNVAQIKPIVEPVHNPDEDKLTKEQGEALLKFVKDRGYTVTELKEKVSFELNIGLSELRNKDILKVKSWFLKPKAAK